MSKPTLKILTQITEPLVNECFNWRTTRPTTICQQPGFFVELVGIIARRLNAAVRFVDSSDFGLDLKMEFSKKDQLFYPLEDGSVDMMTALFDKYDGFGDNLTLSAPVFKATEVYVVAPIKNFNGMFAFFTVYSFSVWIGVFGVFLLFLLLMFVIYWLVLPKIMQFKRQPGFKQLSWRLVRLELLQYETIDTKFLSINALILVFALFNCGLLIQMYNALITTQIVRPAKPIPFKENEVLKVLEEGRYSLIFPNKYRSVYEDAMHSNDPAYVNVRYALRDNPIRFADEMTSNKEGLVKFTLDKVQSGGWITMQPRDIIASIKKMGYCNFIYYDTHFPPLDIHTALRKNYSLLPEINKIILEEQVSLRRLYDKYFKYVKTPKQCDQVRNGPKSLTLAPFVGLLILLAFGLSAGGISFFVEMLIKRKRK